jgi:phospholipid/cholesterol/gamma-HCH transport system substrate-binding protein
MKNTLETRLGIFFALALVVAVVVLELIGGANFFKGGYEITANFKNAQELKKGDLVKMAGVEIGRVESIDLQTDADGVTRAKVTMKIRKDDKVIIRSDSKAIIKFTGLMGQNFVTIEGGSANAAKMEKGALETAEQPDLSTIMVKLENVATGVEGLTKSFSTEGISTLLGPLTDFMKQNKDPLTAMIANFRQVSDNLAQGRGTAGQFLADDSFYKAALGAATNLQSASAEIKTLMTNANNTVTHVDSILGDAKSLIDKINSGQGTLGKLATDDALYNETTTMMANMSSIMQKINRGEGSVGKLLNNDEFYKNAKLSLQKLDKATEGLEDQGPLSILGIAVNSLF